jgi:predicted nuclease of predicted toxin-antitoxin system
MKCVQLDKNTNDKRLAKKCNEQGAVKCCRLPWGLRHATDETIATFAQASDRLIVTLDRTFAERLSGELPHDCPGILILAQADDAVETITTQRAGVILSQFKADFPEWQGLQWDNSVIQMQPAHLYVNQLQAGIVSPRKHIDRTAEGWQIRLQDALLSNSRRSPPPPNTSDSP